MIGVLPSSESVRKCIDIITNRDSAKYFAATLAAKLEKEKVAGKFSGLIEDTKQFADFYDQQTTESDPWTGKFIERTSFQSYQDTLARNAAKKFADKSITFDFAVSDEAEILRGYSSEGKGLSDEESSSLDKLFNAWLAEKGMITKNGVIYEATSDGKIKKSDKGEEIRTDSKKIRQLILDKDEGVSKYVKIKSNSTEISAVPHDYPEKKVEQPSVPPTQEQQTPG